MKRKRKSKNKFSTGYCPTFMAWCPEDQRFEALASTMIAVAGEEGICHVERWNGDPDDDDYVYVPQPAYFVPPRKAIEVIRADYPKHGAQSARLHDYRMPSGRVLTLDLLARRDGLAILGAPALVIALYHEPFVEGGLLPPAIFRLKDVELPPGFEAATAWIMAIKDATHILRRFCTSHPAIMMGCCLQGPEWGVWSAPLTGAASYHADGYPGRDLALSWIHLHDKDPLDLATGWPIDELRKRVDASPPNSSIWIVKEDRISREQILAALDVPGKTLVETLEAAANKFHPRWNELLNAGIGSYMQELIKTPENEKELLLVTEEHIKFIEDYTPAYVEHLDNGAIMLYAHPDRTLWPLWADALDLLGIRAKTT